MPALLFTLSLSRPSSSKRSENDGGEEKWYMAERESGCYLLLKVRAVRQDGAVSSRMMVAGIASLKEPFLK